MRLSSQILCCLPIKLYGYKHVHKGFPELELWCTKQECSFSICIQPLFSYLHSSGIQSTETMILSDLDKLCSTTCMVSLNNSQAVQMLKNHHANM